ncbi:hypothetical protein MCOR25_007657 [Pyricularia grisea]|nr:hypothetical protein MCOR25_007657 [Pyricularia grisea]
MYTDSDSEYTSVPFLSDEAGDGTERKDGSATRSRSKRFLGWAVGCLALVSILTGTGAIISAARQPSVQIDIPNNDCGKSPAEARKRGCVFDPMTHKWTPKICHFPDIMHEFLAVNSTFYFDAEHLHVIPPRELWAGELTVYYPTVNHHLRHCLYTWRKLSYAYMTNSLLDKESASFKHNEHCVKYADPELPTHSTLESRLDYATCTTPGHRQLDYE